ncbi:discoidin domain-containing protein [Peptoniphilus genitalis]|uniref:discoidin domain-containing protein n=1 Tax=Peptoniphilus genitalis TaxID=3036303 RepID=UPI0024AE6AB1|nr:discoidin domain-containing protein [Peptoniphilus sp. Marseille-Q7072]
MDFIAKKQVIINGKSKSKLFYEDRLIWSKLYGEFSKDFKNLEEEEEFFGNYDSQKGCLLVSNKFNILAPIIEFEGENHAKVEYGENFEMPRVRAYSISGGVLEPSLEIYRDGAKVDKVDTKIAGKYELRYNAEIEGKISQTSYVVEVKKGYGEYKNVALKKKVTVSSNYYKGTPEGLVDRDYNQRWTSAGDDQRPELLIDLDGKYLIDKIFIKGFSNFPIKNYDIWGILGDKKINLVSTTNNTSIDFAKEFVPTVVDSVQMTFKGDKGYMRIFEFEVYGKEILG